jgi:hypothetical protein
VLNNLPIEPDRSVPLPKRVFKSALTWALLFATLVFAVLLWEQYAMTTADSQAIDNVAPSINFSAIKKSFFFALPTLLFWIVVFVLIDRFRPARLALWYVALGWGIAVSTWISIYANTWASQYLGVSQTGGDPAASARTAVFVAPFVEEASKATVLFWLAILVRYRLVSKLSMITLAGLSAAGFAFTENIIYYARAIVYSASVIEVGDANSAVGQLVWMRGLFTAFGHPLFTCMTGLGLAVALRTRSKVVRVLAPLIGFGAAALMHMLFNSQVTIQSENTQVWIYFILVLPSMIMLVIALFRQEFAQGRLIRARLTDYVRMGWLNESDPVVFSKLRTRLRALLLALLRGWRPFAATVLLQRTMTELAYLRDAEASGIIDSAADFRAKELVTSTRKLRTTGIDDPREVSFRLPAFLRRIPQLFSRRKAVVANTPEVPGWAPPAVSSTVYGYSAVNPTWGPPPG